MINVYLQGTTTFDNNGEATLIPLSCEFTVGINNAWSLEMEHPYDKEGRYLKLVKDAILRVTGIDFVREWESTSQMVRIYDVKKTLTSVSVIAFPLGMEAQYDAPIEYLFTGANKTGVQAAAMLDDYVKTHDGNTKYTISSDVTETNASGVEWNNTNLIAAIANDFVSDEDGWGGEVVYDNYKIKIRANIGHYNESNPFPVRYGRNLTGLEHEIDSSDIVTRLYPISSDDLRLNDYTDTTHQSGLTYVDSSLISSYPFIRCAFVDIPRKLVDTSKDSNDPTAVLTRAKTTTMYNKMYEKAEALWTAVCNDLTNTRNATYLKTLINGKDGEDGIIQYLQRKFVFKSASFQSLAKSTAKQAVEWIKSEDVPKWEWHENTEVIPHAWWYGDNSVTPATSYAKNCYVLIGKRWEWFNNDGYWVDYKYIPNEDVEWQEAQDDSGRKWFGYKKGYYAHNEYVYMTVEGQMKEWFYDSDGWYVEDSSGDSNKDWHQDSYGYWFGEEGATADDKSKYIHDRWAFIDGTYYWFDQYGYINADPERSFPDWPWGNQETSEGSLWFGNDSDHGMNAKWLANQWAKIDGEWWYFDSDGYAVDMNNIKSATIAWFADEVYNYSISTVKDCLEEMYEFLYDTMTDYCNTYYAQGLDKPTVNVSVDLIDLSKTAEYAEYAPLEKICLGDNVKVVGRDGLSSEARVVGLTYDCIRGYNTKVEIGQLSKTVGQIISNNFKGTDNSSKLVAGDNVIIEQRSNGAQIITVADYTGRTIGLQDVTMNGVSVVSGNVAGFNIAAGENISISRDGRTLTISGEGGGNTVYAGTSTPSANLGAEDDLYLQLGAKTEDILALENFTTNDYDTHVLTITDWVKTDRNHYSFKINGNPDTQGHGEWATFLLDGLVDGNTYHIEFDGQYNSGATFPWNYTDIVAINSNIIINFQKNTNLNHYSGDFTYHDGDYILFNFPAINDNVNFTFTITNLAITGSFVGGIKEIYGKVDSKWQKYEGGESYTAGDNIDITNNVISGAYQPFTGTDGTADGSQGLVPKPLKTDAGKILGANGQWIDKGAQILSGTSEPTIQDGNNGDLYVETVAAGSQYRELWAGSVSTNRWVSPQIIPNVNPSLYSSLLIYGKYQGRDITPYEINANNYDEYTDGVYHQDYYDVYWYAIPDGAEMRISISNNRTRLALWSGTNYTSLVNKVEGVLLDSVSYIKDIFLKENGLWTGEIGEIYSDEEQMCGLWRDGSLLYKKLVPTGGSVPSGATLIERTAMASTGYDNIKYIKS